VIDVALLSVIRRWHLREQVSIRAIARRTGLSRNTIRKYLGNGVIEARYPKRKSRSNLDAFAERLTERLKTESARGRRPTATGKLSRQWLTRAAHQNSVQIPGQVTVQLDTQRPAQFVSLRVVCNNTLQIEIGDSNRRGEDATQHDVGPRCGEEGAGYWASGLVRRNH
jgi:hypothetical protein